MKPDASWATALSKLSQLRTEPIPKGYLSATQLASQWNVKPARARQRLAELHSAGLVDKKLLKVIVNDCPRLIPHDKPI